MNEKNEQLIDRLYHIQVCLTVIQSKLQMNLKKEGRKSHEL